MVVTSGSHRPRGGKRTRGRVVQLRRVIHVVPVAQSPRNEDLPVREQGRRMIIPRGYHIPRRIGKLTCGRIVQHRGVTGIAAIRTDTSRDQDLPVGEEGRSMVVAIKHRIRGGKRTRCRVVQLRGGK